MKLSPSLLLSNCAQSNRLNRTFRRPPSALLIRAAALLVLFGLLVIVFYSGSSASSANRVSRPESSAVAIKKAGKVTSDFSSLLRTSPAPSFLLPQASESIATYDENCSVAKTDFNLGDKVCVKATGVPDTPFLWHVAWGDPAGIVRQSDTAIANDVTTYIFTIPSTSTSVVDGLTVNNLGNWDVNLNRSNGARRQSARFTVHKLGDPKADVFIRKFQRDTNIAINAGDNVAFVIVVSNDGPDPAQNIHLADSTPSGGTLVSFTLQSGPTCTPVAGVDNDCTIASLGNGGTAEFTAIYNVGSNSAGSYSTSATATSTTPDPNSDNNSSTTEFNIISGSSASTCELTCPSSQTVAANTTENGQQGAHVTFSNAVGSGSCGTITFDIASGSFFPVGTTTVIATSGNGDASCSFTITVTQNTNGPTISCPSDQSVTAPAGSCSATVDVGTPATTGNGVTVAGIRSDGHALTDPYPSGKTTITWTATDSSNQTATCQQIIDVTGNDTTPPVPDVNPLPTITKQCSVMVDAPTATDACSGKISATTNDPRTYDTPGTYTVHWAYTDAAGNSVTQNQTVEVVADTTAPVPDLAQLPTITGECTAMAGIPTQVVDPTTGQVQTVNKPPTATDNCSGAEVVGTTTDPLTYTAYGAYTVHWTFTDGSGNTSSQNQVVNVTDSSPPVIASVPADVTVTCRSDIPAADPSQAIATDNCSAAPTVTVSDSSNGGQGSASSPLVITRTFTATDGAGHTASKAQTITVIDNTPPTITAPANVSVGTGPGATSCGATISDATLGTASASDNCAGVTVTRSPSGNTFSVGVTTITWTATDASGNQATAVQTVTVTDNTPPTITAPANVTAYTGPGATSCGTTISNATLGTASASDNCAGVTVSRTPSGNTFPVGATDVTWIATDAAGNTTIAHQTVTVIDNTPPVISCPTNITAYLPLHSTATGMAVSYPAATATDNCSSSPTISYTIASGSTFSVGTTPVTVTATDANGNSASCTFTITVLYDFTGFFSPIGNLPTLNVVKAGSAVPVKFSLSGNKGLAIFAADYPLTVSSDCGTAVGTDVTETVTAGGSSLSYDATSDQYVYVWKTDSSWVGTCRQLIVKLNDGTSHVANFKFK